MLYFLLGLNIFFCQVIYGLFCSNAGYFHYFRYSRSGLAKQDDSSLLRLLHPGAFLSPELAPPLFWGCLDSGFATFENKIAVILGQ